MSTTPYQQYKESGIGWIKTIPSEWDVLPLYAVATECDESNKGMLEDNLLSLSYGRIVNKDINSNDGLLPESFETYQVVQPNDMVLRLTDLQNDKRSLRSAIVKERGIITSAYLALRPHGILPEYFSYLLRAYDLSKVFYSMGGGLRQSMKFSDIKRMPIVIPSLDEQKHIAKFLDKETIKIDSLILEQEKLVELLKKKRKAIISSAVTRGLDTNVRLKDSGVEWLGEIPEHWEVGSIKRFFISLDSRRIPLSAEERSYRVGDYPYYGASGPIDTVDEYIFDEDLVLVSEDGANLLNRSTPISFIARGKYWVNNHAHILKPIDEALTYWSERIEAVDLTVYITGAAQPKLTIEALMNIKIAVPKAFDEKIAISNFIKHEAEKSDSLINESLRTVELLRERRSSLISDAITGKFDVRNVETA